MNLNNLHILENTSKSTNRTLCDSVNKACKKKRKRRRKVGLMDLVRSSKPKKYSAYYHSKLLHYYFQSSRDGKTKSTRRTRPVALALAAAEIDRPSPFYKKESPAVAVADGRRPTRPPPGSRRLSRPCSRAAVDSHRHGHGQRPAAGRGRSL